MPSQALDDCRKLYAENSSGTNAEYGGGNDHWIIDLPKCRRACFANATEKMTFNDFMSYFVDTFRNSYTLAAHAKNKVYGSDCLSTAVCRKQGIWLKNNQLIILHFENKRFHQFGDEYFRDSVVWPLILTVF